VKQRRTGFYEEGETEIGDFKPGGYERGDPPVIRKKTRGDAGPRDPAQFAGNDTQDPSPEEIDAQERDLPVAPSLGDAGEAQSSRPGAAGVTPSPRAMLEQRGAQLGVDYAGYLPTAALLGAVHEREAEASPEHESEGLADRIEHAIDTIGLPLLHDPETDAPPPQGREPLTRAGLEQRAARLGGAPLAALPSDWLLAAIHSREADAAPQAASAALADHIERDIDQAGALAGIPSFSEDSDDTADQA